MADKKKILINTGGGDAPGLNAVIRSATLAALEQGWEVWGIRHGYRGMLEPNGLVHLDRDAVRGIAHLGGTILGTANRGDPFHYPTKTEGHAKPVPVDRSDEVVARFKELGFDALIAIGGDGSLTMGKKLLDKGLPRVIGVPKTIDNDVAGTDITFGFDTAVSIATEAIDRLHTTTEAHERVMVVEVMGRHAGWIAVTAGLAGGGDAILIPEIPFTAERVAEKVLQRERRGRRFSIVVVAEGAIPSGGALAVKSQGDEFRGVPVLGGIAERIAVELGRLTGKETRSMVLGHLQRGGHPSSGDRVLALRFGAAAIGEIANSTASGMVAMRGGDVRLVPLEEAAGRTRTVPVDRGIVCSARELGICFGDEPERHFSPA
ncbi:MAG: ATP-dependent 6-phosphofructokinase [Polyangiaceae bacterium]|nr:ATP-dependent 6-phosphofructokinase [Polyangiaceae bacterium]